MVSISESIFFSSYWSFPDLDNIPRHSIPGLISQPCPSDVSLALLLCFDLVVTKMQHSSMFCWEWLFVVIMALLLSQIVFSDAWWIGRRDDNPEEARLEFPTDFNMVSPLLSCSISPLIRLQKFDCRFISVSQFQICAMLLVFIAMLIRKSWLQEQIEYDFKGGAGGTYEKKSTTSKPRVKLGEEQSPKLELQDDSSESLNNSEELAEVTPTRHSARMAGKAFKYIMFLLNQCFLLLSILNC